MHEDVFASIVTAFGHELRAAGIPVSPDRCERFARAVILANTSNRREIYWIGRVTLLTDHAQVPRYDALFERFFREQFAEYLERDTNEPGPEPAPIPDRNSSEEQSEQAVDELSMTASAVDAVPTSDDGEEPDESDEDVAVMVSSEERLMDADFAQCTPEELALIRFLVHRIRLTPPMRRARRMRRDARGSVIDLRATLRAAQRTGGEPAELMRRKTSARPRRVVLITDVSGSMEPYARVYLHLMRGAVLALNAEAFAFSTRLTRLSRSLQTGTADQAYTHARAAAKDWSGGTRIGQALEDFIRNYGRRGMARGAIIVIVSDGWDTGEPERLTMAMQQLGRMAHRIIWVNPRKAAPGYVPAVAGMKAALPYVDTFVSGHSVRALQEVVAAIAADDTAVAVA